MPSRSGRRAPRVALVLALLSIVAAVVLTAAPASAQTTTEPGADAPVEQAEPAETAENADTGVIDTNDTGEGDASISIDLGGTEEKPSQSVLVIILLTLLAVAPALIVMMTSFTRIVIVLSLTRNALGLQGVPPNQVIVGLALFLSLFVMAPTLKEVNDKAIQPMLDGKLDQTEAWEIAIVPMREFMLSQTDSKELAMFTSATDSKPETPDDIELSTLIPAFILSELKKAFIIGFVVFVPFLIVDLAVSSTLMSMGMMMLPPVVVSLPFKLLLFVMVDGWGLVVRSLIKSYA